MHLNSICCGVAGNIFFQTHPEVPRLHLLSVAFLGIWAIRRRDPRQENAGCFILPQSRYLSILKFCQSVIVFFLSLQYFCSPCSVSNSYWPCWIVILGCTFPPNQGLIKTCTSSDELGYSAFALGTFHLEEGKNYPTIICDALLDKWLIIHYVITLKCYSSACCAAAIAIRP